MELFTVKNSIYLVSNLFRIYVIFRFLNIFFENKEINKRKELLGYLGYFSINSLLYLIYNSPMINLANNLILFFILTYLYDGQVSLRLIVTFLNLAMAIALETGVYFIASKFDINEAVILLISNAVGSVFMFISVLILEKYMSFNSNYRIKNSHFISLLLVPLGSIVLLVTTILLNNTVNNNEMIINISIILMINFLVFYLYDEIIKSYDKEYKNEVLKQQNKAYRNQFEIIKESNHNIRTIKHDFINHLSALYILAKKDKNDKVLNYISAMRNAIEIDNEYINTGNDEIDSILNYKLHEAKKIGALIDTEIKVPRDYNILYFDLNVILGNLLDNAIEALNKVKDKKLNIEMKLDKGAFYIKIINTFNGEIKTEINKLTSLKDNKEFHGIGLENVKKIVKKYNGTTKIKHSKSQFIIEILLFN